MYLLTFSYLLYMSLFVNTYEMYINNISALGRSTLLFLRYRNFEIKYVAFLQQWALAVKFVLVYFQQHSYGLDTLKGKSN